MKGSVAGLALLVNSANSQRRPRHHTRLLSFVDNMPCCIGVNRGKEFLHGPSRTQGKMHPRLRIRFCSATRPRRLRAPR